MWKFENRIKYFSCRLNQTSKNQTSDIAKNVEMGKTRSDTPKFDFNHRNFYFSPIIF